MLYNDGFTLEVKNGEKQIVARYEHWTEQQSKLYTHYIIMRTKAKNGGENNEKGRFLV